MGYYRALWGMDLWADFIEPAGIKDSSYKVIIVPLHWVGKQATCDALLAYVKSGGILVLENAFGLFDEKFYYNAVIPPYGLSKEFGYREKQNSLVRGEAPDASVAPDELIYYQPEIKFSDPIAVRIKAHTFLTPLEVTSATVIGTYEGQPVAVKKKVGRGEIFYFGTCLGGRLGENDPGAMRLLQTITRQVAKPEVTATTLRPRLVHGDGQSLLMVFNDTPQDQTARIELPPGFQMATDIYTTKEQAISGRGIEVAVPYEDVAVLLLT
jgi:beta-galactosidase GanA